MRALLGRQRALLAVVKELREPGRYSRTALEKTLFLLSKEYALGKARFYSFFPYRFGPFSINSYNDLSFLKANGLLSENESLTVKAAGELKRVDAAFKRQAAECVGRFGTDRALLDYVYATYPRYAVKSELKPKAQRSNKKGFCTAGYEGHDIDSFLDLMVQNCIETVADVRKNPFSMNFAFTKNRLASSLRKAGIEYRHFGELGIEGSKRKNIGSPVERAKLFREYGETTLKENGAALRQIIGIGGKQRTALLCFERNEKDCHRGVIAREIEAATGEKVVAL